MAAVSLATATMLATSAAAETVEYLCKGNEMIAVSNDGGTTSCLRVAVGFEMCNGMVKQENGYWTGKNMRHPNMPKFMKFNGMVVISEAGMNIRGCALGICQAKDWTLN